MDKALLVLGGGPDQIPGILKAKEMGIYTIVLDGNKDADGKKYADEFYTVSIKHFEQIEQFIKTTLTKKVDGVIAFGVDIASIIARTADLLNVNYTIPIDSALLSEDKFIAKEFMHKHSIPVPKYKQVDTKEDILSFIQEVGFPVIVKPVDNSAARGISFVENHQQALEAYEYAQQFTKQKKILIEKYLDGPQISTETLIVNGKVHNIGLADRNYSDMKKFLPNIIENGGDLPSMYMNNLHKKSLTDYLQKISKELNIKNAVIKGDIVLHNNELYIIEFALRLSGGNFSTILIPESTGVDFIKASIKLYMNMHIEDKELVKTENNCLSLRYKFIEDEEDTNQTKIKNILLPKQQKEILHLKVYPHIGQVIKYTKTTEHLNRLAFVIVKGENRESAISYAQNVLDQVRIIKEL